MLVDDSEADLLFTQIVLERSGQGFEVLPFDQARDALDHLREPAHGVRLILLDINMPGMDGFEFLEAWRRLPRQQREDAAVVMLSSSSDPADRRRALSVPGVADYLTKPLDLAAASALTRHLSS